MLFVELRPVNGQRSKVVTQFGLFILFNCLAVLLAINPVNAIGINQNGNFILRHLKDDSSPPFGLHLGPCTQSHPRKEKGKDGGFVKPFHIVLKDNCASFVQLDTISNTLIVEDEQVYLSWNGKSWYELLAVQAPRKIKLPL